MTGEQSHMACRLCSGYHKRWSLGAVKIRTESKCWVSSEWGRGISVSSLLWRLQSTRASWSLSFPISSFGIWRLWILPSHVMADVGGGVNSPSTGSTQQRLSLVVVCDDQHPLQSGPMTAAMMPSLGSQRWCEYYKACTKHPTAWMESCQDHFPTWCFGLWDFLQIYSCFWENCNQRSVLNVPGD